MVYVCQIIIYVAPSVQIVGRNKKSPEGLCFMLIQLSLE